MSFQNANLPLTDHDVVILDAYCDYLRVAQEELYQFGCNEDLPKDLLQLVRDMEVTVATIHRQARDSELAHEGWVHTTLDRVVSRASMMLSMLKAL